MKESTMPSELVMNPGSSLSEFFSTGTSPTAPIAATICKLDIKTCFLFLALLSLGWETGSDLVGAYFHNYPYALLPKLTGGN